MASTAAERGTSVCRRPMKFTDALSSSEPLFAVSTIAENNGITKYWLPAVIASTASRKRLPASVDRLHRRAAMLSRHDPLL